MNRTSRIVTWYTWAFGISILLYLLVNFYPLEKNDKFRVPPPPPQTQEALNAITRLEKLYKKLLQHKLKSGQQLLYEIEDDFRRHWYRQRKSRVDWEQIIRPCVDDMEWGQVKAGWDKSKRSSASRSTIDYYDVRPAREFSRIFIQSRTKDGRIKSIGGDTWRVYLRGPASIAATVFDHNNGTYEALVLVMEPGFYRLEVSLDYSLCDGFRNPPVDWFIRGNIHGKNQKEGILGFLDDYLKETMNGQLSINITKPRLTTPIEKILSQPYCNGECDFLVDGYGRWIGNAWLPFLNESDHSTVVSGRGPSGMLVSYGDSLALRFGASLASNRKTCGELYQACFYRYNWIYPVGNEQADMQKQDDFDFNEGRVISYIRQDLQDSSMNNITSTLVINLGLHFVESLNFTTYQHLINNVIGVFIEKQNVGQNKRELSHKARIIWKTTTAIRKENAIVLNSTRWRFFTTQRILLFNSYATWAMCKAGIPVLDVHPVTDSYAPGPMDVVHYPNFVFSDAEKALEVFKTNELNGKKRSINLLRLQIKEFFHNVWLSYKTQKMDTRNFGVCQIIGYGLSLLFLILVNNLMTFVVPKFAGCTFVSVSLVFVMCSLFLLYWYKYIRRITAITTKTKADREFLMDALRSVETSKIPYVVDRFLELDKAGETNEEQEERISRIPLDSCCVVCLSSEACIRTLPCSHTVTCGWCAWQSLKISFKNGTPHRCVICRTEIEDFTGSLIKNLMNIKWKDVRKIIDEIKK